MTNTQLDEFEQLLEETLSKTYSVADIVEGTVVRKEKDGYLISVHGAKTEAFLPEKEIPSSEEETTFEIGDIKEFYVLKEESDEEGMTISDLEKKIRAYHPKMLYTIPTFQNPTGKTLPEDRRGKIAELASEYHMVVAEDDPYRDLRYEGIPVPSIKSFDRDGWVMFLGSFSKIISPGLRVGYIAGHPDLIRKCTVGKQSTDVHTANLNQAVVDQFIRRNLLPDHIKTICTAYGEKMKFMLSKLAEFPGDVRYTKPQGGLFIWAELPKNLNAKSLLDKAIERKVAFVPGTHFCVGGGHENTIRLNFSNSTMEQIETGMNILRDLVSETI